MSKHPNCDKLNEHTEEYNAIAKFIEWLHENRMCIGVWRDPEAPYTSAYTGKTGTIREIADHLLEHPYPFSQPTPNLLYKYFGVDPAGLERERRQILEDIRGKQE
jgi:hypothetical protein